jgi:hypothetical protein
MRGLFEKRSISRDAHYQLNFIDATFPDVLLIRRNISGFYGVLSGKNHK